MSWCPKCKEEYQDGIKNCGECGAVLVESLTKTVDKVDDKLKLVYMAQTEDEVRVAVSYLESFGINIVRKEKGSGSYMKIAQGYSVFGTDLYVLESEYDKAMELLADMEYSSKMDDGIYEDEATKVAAEGYRRRRLVIIWTIVSLSIIIPGLLILYSNIFM